VHILLFTESSEPMRRLQTALEAAGFTVERWSPGQEPGAPARLALVEGLDRVIDACAVGCDIVALVPRSELSLFPECPRDVADFVVKPFEDAEVIARVRRLANEPDRMRRTHRRLLASAVEHASDIIELTTADGVVEYVNAVHETTLGRPSTVVVGQIAAQMIEAGSAGSAAALSRGDSWSGTLVSERPDGNKVYLDSTVTPIMDAKGLITHHVAVKRDITARLATQAALEQANNALQQARDAAVAASRAKSEFLANMSHELRTPLNAVIGYTEMVMEELADDGQSVDDLQSVLSAARTLLQLINDLLDIAKLESDRIDLAPELTSVALLVGEVTASLEPLAIQNQNKLHVRLDDGPREIYADPTRLRQILKSLISNAYKFTERGEVHVEAASTSRDGRPGIELRVRDTGIGISPEQQADIFEPFAQADGSSTRRFGGTGLGLVISKRLCDLMGGEISLHSEAGVGSTFTVYLPHRADAR
jgi:PAS domain S-box-containing protein